MKEQTRFRMLAAGLAVAVFLDLAFCLGCLSAKETPPSPQEGADLGELKLQGKYIERLVLRLKDGGRKEFNKPSETIKLPAGEYQLQEVRLQGGYSSGITMPISDANWVTVGQDKPAELEVGAPLKQAIRVERRGSVLVLNYELSGIGGEKYTSDRRGEPPRFIVYRAGREIASGKFQYG